MTEVAIDPDPLRLTHCMRCGYSLETLAPEGTCPECGISYDQGTVVLEGMWAGNSGAASGSPGSVAAVIVIMCVWLFCDWTLHGSEDHFGAILSLLVFSVGAAIDLAFWFTARRAANGGALLQIRFNRFGCLQCDVPEETTGAVDLRRIGRSAGLWSVIAIACLFLHDWFLGAGIAVVLLIDLGIRRRRRSAIQLAQQDPDARVLMVAARDRGQQVLVTACSAISQIRVAQLCGKPIRAGSNRYHLKSIGSARHIQIRSAINAEIEATAEQIRNLQSRIARWRLGGSSQAGREAHPLRA